MNYLKWTDTAKAENLGMKDKEGIIGRAFRYAGLQGSSPNDAPASGSAKNGDPLDVEMEDANETLATTMKEASVSHKSNANNDVGNDDGNGGKDNDDDDEVPGFVAKKPRVEDKVEEENVSTSSSFLSCGDDVGSECSFSSSEVEEEEEEEVMKFANAAVDRSETLNMKLLCSCIENGSTTSDKVRDQDVVVVVGGTGAGKSLLCQGLAGKKIVQVKHTTSHSGKTACRTVFEAEDALPGFEVGHEKISKTRFINCFVRPGTGKEKPGCFYVDVPGFKDTAGPEVDVATCVMLNQVANNAKSLRIVVLVNYASLLDARGSAVRSVLKLVNTFVSDFEASKKSFMFLFTHTNEVDMPSNLDAARSHLEQELLCIMTGTDDDDVRTVLKFMHRSLEKMRKKKDKKYRFVDILDPLKSDFKGIAHFVETKLSPIKNPAQLVNCGLTSPAHMKLMGQLQRMLLMVRGLLCEKNTSNQGVQELKCIRDTLEYLNHYIEIPEVQKACDDCRSLLEKHVSSQRLIVEEELQQAEGSAHFGARNVNSLQAAIAFSDENIAKYFDNRVGETFFTLYARVMQSASIELSEETLSGLGRLKVWSGGFDRFVEPYNVARRACSFKRRIHLHTGNDNKRFA